MILSLMGGLFVLNAWAAPAPGMKAPDFLLHTEWKEDAFFVRATSPAGVHFNLKAPMAILTGKEKDARKIKPQKASPLEVEFLLKKDGLKPEAQEGWVSLDLCDEAQTFCENHKVPITLPGGSAFGTNAKPAPSVAPLPEKEKKEVIPVSGAETLYGKNRFILNDAKGAFELASQLKQPLLIDFYAIWCPACNMLDQEVFSKGEFRKLAKEFVKLKADADLDSVQDLKSKFKVGGYPTVVFATSDGQEIFRTVGYTDAQAFLKDVRLAWENRTQPDSQLRELADRGDEGAIRRIGLLLMQRKEHEDAAKYLGKLPTLRLKYLENQAERFENKDATKWAETEKTLISEFPDSPQALEGRGKLADSLKGEARMQMLREIVQAGKRMIASPEKLKGTDYLIQDVLALMGDAHEQLGENEQARAVYGHAAEEFKKVLKGERDRGGHLELAYYSWKSGNFQVAEKIYRRMETLFPREFTFHYAHARMHFETKKYSEAEPLAQKAVKFSYGDNRLRAIRLLARVQDAEGKRKEALRVLRNAIEEFSAPGKIPADLNARTLQHLKALQELESKLSQK